MKIPLFDVDWTLLSKDKKHNIHGEAFLYAFDRIYGIINPKPIDGEGKVDSQIIIETVILNGISEEVAWEKLKETIKTMKRYFKEHRDQGTFKTLPGVREILETLRIGNIPIGLLTGNVEEIAWGKLEKAGIKDFFSFGAFGDQAHKRVKLIEIARRTAEQKLNRRVLKEEFAILGDTPRDVLCAKEGGVASIAVASGPYSMRELKEAGADLVVPSLRDKKAILDFLDKN